jgi:hypothetical protein
LHVKKSSIVASTALVIGALTMTRDAHALGPIDLEIGAKLGEGTNPFSSGPNPLGFGLGARAGVSLLGLYGGLNVMYYFGSTDNVGPVSVSVYSTMYGIEAGYGFSLLMLTIRPQVGIGNFTATANGNAFGVSGSKSQSNLYLEPGVTALVSFGLLFVGADANLLVLPGIAEYSGKSQTDTAFTVHAQVGIKL